jgi:hypothetical protein
VPVRRLVLLACLALPAIAAAHGHGEADAHATEELSELYKGVTSALLDERPSGSRPLVRYQLRGASLTNQDPFSHAVASALARHHGDDHEEEHGEGAPQRDLRGWVKALPGQALQGARALPGKLTNLTLRLSADAWQGAKEYGPIYAAYTGLSEAVEHAAVLVFPPLMFFEFNLVTQPLFFAVAKPTMIATSIATHGGSGVPLLKRLRSIPGTTTGLLLKGGARAFDVSTGESLRRRQVKKSLGKGEEMIAHVAKSPFWAEAHLAEQHAVKEASGAPMALGAYVGGIFEEAPKGERLGRVARLDSGFGMLRSSLGELIGASFAQKKITTKQFFQHKATLGKLGRLSRTVTATLATYAGGDASAHGAEATSLVKQLAGLFHDAHALTRGDHPDQRAALEAGIKSTMVSLKAFRRGGAARR